MLADIPPPWLRLLGGEQGPRKFESDPEALYGSLVWGVFPIRPGVSWETHLAAALIGLALAIALRHLDIPPRKRYAWEDETDGDEDQDKEK